MNKTLKILLIVFIFGLMGGNTSKASQLNFSVNPEIPDNQQDKDRTYFDIKLGPSQEQELKVMLKNDTNKEVTVETSFNRATTNLNGVVEYIKTNDKVDTSLKYNIEDYVKVIDKKTVIPANGEKEVIIKANTPKEVFDGILVGGLTFKEINSSEITNKKDKKNNGLAIENDYAYVVGFVMHGNGKSLVSNVKLLDVAAGQVNARNVINATIQNPIPEYLNDVSIEAKISKKGSKDILYESNNKDMQMAPNSNFKFPIALNGKPLKPGNYTLSMRVDSKKNNWEFSKDFTVKKDIADKLNEKDVSIEESYEWIYFLIGILLFVVIIAVSFFLYIKKKKEKERRYLIREKKKRIAMRKKKEDVIKRKKNNQNKPTNKNEVAKKI